MKKKSHTSTLILSFLFFLFSGLLYAQEEELSIVYQDTIPHHISFSLKKPLRTKKFELYKIKENNDYIIYLVFFKNYFKNDYFINSSVTNQFLAIAIDYKNINKKIGLFYNTPHKISVDNGTVFINREFRYVAYSKPILLNEHYEVSMFTKLDKNDKGKIILQDINNPCELKITEWNPEIKLKELYSIFHKEDYVIEKGDCEVLKVYGSFSGW